MVGFRAILTARLKGQTQRYLPGSQRCGGN
jgi:hypothetical protein